MRVKYISTWWLIPRLVSGLVHPSDLHGIFVGLIHWNHWGELTHLRFVGWATKHWSNWGSSRACQSNRVYPAEVRDLQILRRYIRLGSNPSRLQEALLKTNAKNSEVEVKCNEHVQYFADVKVLAQEWKNGIHSFPIQVYFTFLTPIFSRMNCLAHFRENVPYVCGINSSPKSDGGIWWKDPLELDGIGLQDCILNILIIYSCNLFVKNLKLSRNALNSNSCTWTASNRIASILMCLSKRSWE